MRTKNRLGCVVCATWIYASYHKIASQEACWGGIESQIHRPPHSKCLPSIIDVLLVAEPFLDATMEPWLRKVSIERKLSEELDYGNRVKEGL